MKKHADWIVASIIILTVTVIGVYRIAASKAQGDHLVEENVYKGIVSTEHDLYQVEIYESDYGNGFSRIMHLGPTDDLIFKSITGHDYDDDGQFDRVFYCGNHKMVGSHSKGDEWEFGCNSVTRTADGWRFKACPADQGLVQPFSAEAIEFALSELRFAMERVHNSEHISQRWRWDASEGRPVKVLDRTAVNW
jgi:hypothetical protein